MKHLCQDAKKYEKICAVPILDLMRSYCTGTSVSFFLPSYISYGLLYFNLMVFYFYYMNLFINYMGLYFCYMGAGVTIFLHYIQLLWANLFHIEI